jgi:hypothetical protein
VGINRRHFAGFIKAWSAKRLLSDEYGGAEAKNPPSEEDGPGDQADAAVARSAQAGVARPGRDA